MYNVCPMFCTFHNNISKCYVLLPGITMVTLSVRPVPSVQVSTTPLSCSRSATVPVNVRVELRHVALLLSFSVNVTPLAGIGTRHVVPDANTLMVPLNTELDQMRRLLLLLQVYLSVGGCRNFANWHDFCLANLLDLNAPRCLPREDTFAWLPQLLSLEHVALNALPVAALSVRFYECDDIMSDACCCGIKTPGCSSLSKLGLCRTLWWIFLAYV